MAATLAPGLGLGPLDREGDLLFLGVDAENVDLDLLPDLEHFAWVPHAAPGELGEVNESVRAADVDERAEVADRGDATLADLALLQLPDQSLLHHIAPLLNSLALRKNQTVAVAVDLDDLEGKR